MTTERRTLTEYNAFENGLMSLTGRDYEDAEAHPGFLLARIATDTTVYGWWPTDYNTPCLAWKSPRGWSATIVDTAGDGWPNSLFFIRATELCDALFDATEPTTLLDLLDTACQSAADDALAEHWTDKNKGLAWGLLRLLDATARTRGEDIAAKHGLDLTNAGEALLDGNPLAEGDVTIDDLTLTHAA